MLILLITVLIVTVMVLLLTVSHPSEEMTTATALCIAISIGVFVAYRFQIVSEKIETLNISHVERRLDNTTYCYTSNNITGDLYGIKIPDGVDLLTDEQLMEDVKIDCYNRTRRNGKQYFVYILKY